MKAVVFSDLDGTLLDHHTYSHEAAAPALKRLLAGHGELVLVSSKTRAEMLALRQELGLSSPFISENGGGVFVPEGHALAGAQGLAPAGPGWLVHEIGLPVAELRQRFAPFAQQLKGKSFHQMSDREVAGLTGLPLEKAALARQREFNEPWHLDDPEGEGGKFFALAQKAGLQATRGGRFFHLLGGGDKGKAVSWLLAGFREAGQQVASMGIGDAANDLPMLLAVEHGVQVARHDGQYADLGPSGIAKAGDIGPVGWNLAVAAWLDSLP